jgi:glycogen phosphorylase
MSDLTKNDSRGRLDPAQQQRLDRLGLSIEADRWPERYLLNNQLVDPAIATSTEQFTATCRFIRDLLSHRWMKTRRAREHADPKRIHYLSMEYLLGRTLRNNMMNLAADPIVRHALEQQGWNLEALMEEESDPGLGNGGLGRLAACFIDSLATMQYAAIGYGLRYQYGIFRQEIRDCTQVEQPDGWLRKPDPWEIARPYRAYAVPLNAGFELRGSMLRFQRNRPSTLLGIAYDRPVVGYGGECINTLRLWSAEAPQSFNLAEFSTGDFAGAVIESVAAESVTRVLYPDDSTDAGRALRFIQQYFMVSCSLQDICARFSRGHLHWAEMPRHAAVQMNDTHPSLCVAELMRILLDQAHLGWDEAWDVTRATLAYTNHTLLPEALEKWPVDLFEMLIPRQLEIIYEINRRFLDDVRRQRPADEELIQRVSLIEDGPTRRVRMANLAVVGSHSVNGVAQIHSDLLRTRVLRDFAELFPERFNNKTNGVTPRRWLNQCNPWLSRLITEAIGDRWVMDLSEIEGLRPLADDSAFRDQFRAARHEAKLAFVDWLRKTSGEVVDPYSIFDSQIKRIHEYKRQLLNLLHTVVLYQRLRRDPGMQMTPRTVFFAGKAAPAYHFAKLIIRLINHVAATINADPVVHGRLKVLFLPEYNVSLAERLIPASDVSEQISTAGFEASGTGNMKFMMNGALTIGTRDGATIEMAAAAGEENFFLFGLTAEQVAASAGWYNPRWHYENELETREALDLIGSNYFNASDPGLFAPICDALLNGDHYRHLADLTDYSRAHQDLAACYLDPQTWWKKAIINVASSGRFSSDRTVKQYADEIWGLEPCPVG